MTGESDAPTDGKLLPRGGEVVPGLLIVAVMMICFALLIDIWPDSGETQSCVLLCGFSPERKLMLITLLAGACGASLHLARSYTYFRGMGKFDDRWSAWYLLRIPMGMALALLFYFVARAGLFTGSSFTDKNAPESANYFGFAALAGLTGMFAKQATGKLEETFNTLFGTSDDDTRPRPVLSPFTSPVKMGASASEREVTVAGSGFRRSSTVNVSGSARPSRFVSDMQLAATLADADVAIPGKLVIIVSDGSMRSNAELLDVVA